ncbi:MAG: hypothetical protein ACQEQC_07415, partial [Elusimicrobiota bacterium]
VAVVLSFLFIVGLDTGYGMQRIKTKFTDIILAGMKPGMVYSVKQEENVPYTVINDSKETAQMEVLIEKPKSRYLKKGYEPIPDPTWIKVNPANFTLEPGEEIDCDLIISIPEDEEYSQRHFQAMIVTQSAGTPNAEGVQIDFALANRLRFSTGPRPEEIFSEYKEKVLSALEMEMMPMSLHLDKKIPVGTKVDLDGFDISVPQITNRSRKDYEIKVEVDKEISDYGGRAEYDSLPEEAKINLTTDTIKADSRTIKDVTMELKLPDKEEYLDKKFGFAVVGKVLGFDMPIELFSRVYFTTEK